MNQKVIVGFSVGTCVFIAMLLAAVSTLFTVAVIELHSSINAKPDIPKVFEPKTGAVGEFHRLKNDLDYGPVNLQAAKETKDGIIANIRARRQARCAPQQSPTYCQPQPQSYPTQAVRICDPSDCVAAYTTATATVASPVVLQPTGITEYPEAKAVTKPDCDECKKVRSPAAPTTKSLAKSGVKTGAFVCSKCRRSRIGDEWHTDWNEDGSPVTFLCEECYSSMDEAQLRVAYNAYAARQAKHANGTLHQEIAK